MKLISGEVHTLNRNNIPNENVSLYYRSKESCQFARGNWIINFYCESNDWPSFSIKLPIEMKENEIYSYKGLIIGQN